MPSENKTPNYGLNQWQGNEYPKRQDFVDDNAIIDTELKKAEEHREDENIHVTRLSCTKAGNVFVLTELTATAGFVPCVFKAPSAYAIGNTFTVNGTNYSIQTTNGAALAAGAFAAGAVVSILLDVDNKVLHIQKVAMTKADIGLPNVDNTADANKSVNYANTSGTANYGNYSSHAVSSGSAALRNITALAASPSGGSDGDVWFVG